MFGASSKILEQALKEYENYLAFFTDINCYLVKSLDHVSLKSGNFAEKTYFVCSELSKVLQISFHFKKAY